jgi:hypothetical protein
LGIELHLQSLDLSSLIGDLLPLAGELSLERRGGLDLPLLLLSLGDRLVVLLDELVAGVSGKPDQTAWLRGHGWNRKLRGLHPG